jgi:Flp pilus assembly protein TadB
VNHVTVIKYASAVTILIAMVLHVAGITPWNSIVQMVGAAGWIYVGYRWNEKAIILNFLPQFAIIIPMLVMLYWP